MTNFDLAELAKKPPTSSFKTMENAISQMKAAGVLPPKIDKRFWGNLSGTVAAQLVAAFRFLGLIDDGGVPTDQLRELNEAHGTEAWNASLNAVISAAYAPVMDVGLDKVHGSHLKDKFKDVFAVEGDQQRKAIAFFLFAARSAGIKLSPYLKLRERSANRGQRKKREKPSDEFETRHEDDPRTEQQKTPVINADVTAEAMTRILTSKPPKKVQQAVMTVILYLTMGKEAFEEEGDEKGSAS
jgi:hypothetical protein